MNEYTMAELQERAAREYDKLLKKSSYVFGTMAIIASEMANDVCQHRELAWELAAPPLPYRWRCSACEVINVALPAGASLIGEFSQWREGL